MDPLRTALPRAGRLIRCPTTTAADINVRHRCGRGPVGGRPDATPEDAAKRWPCTRRRAMEPRTRHIARLRPGRPTAPEGGRLPLLPSGPDGVHGPSLRGTRPSTSSDGVGGGDRRPRPGIQPRCSGLRVQGTASSPPSTAAADSSRAVRIGQSGRSSRWRSQRMHGGYATSKHTGIWRS